MRNIRLLLRYDGTRYSGWQSQEHEENTIQGRVTAVLERLTGETIRLAGSGRTDAGVHALGQTANFRTESALSCEELKMGLNRYLPEDIAVYSVEEAELRFHSRLNALRKTYRYRIWNSPVHNVFERKYLYSLEQELDEKAMEQAAARLREGDASIAEVALSCGFSNLRTFNRVFKQVTSRRPSEFRKQAADEPLTLTYRTRKNDSSALVVGDSPAVVKNSEKIEEIPLANGAESPYNRSGI